MTIQQPLIITFSADSHLLAQIDQTANAMGYACHAISNADAFDSAEIEDRPGEPVAGGQTTELVYELVNSQPSLIFFDVDATTIPWQRWLAIIKSSPATRNFPCIAFSVVNPEQAMPYGVDHVTLRPDSAERISQLIREYARYYDLLGIADACQQPLSELAQHGIDLFNRGEFYEAHHGLEAAWNEDQGPARNLYRAILQIAVAYLQIERKNYRGAIKMFMRVKQWLVPLPPVCRGIKIAELSQSAQAAHDYLLTLGPDRIGEFDRTFFKPVQMV